MGRRVLETRQRRNQSFGGAVELNPSCQMYCTVGPDEGERGGFGGVWMGCMLLQLIHN
jgi:hypothetical protein